MRHSGRWNALGRYALAAASVLLSFVVFDLIAGALLLPTLSPAIESDPILHHRLAPGTVSEISEAEYRYRQHVNELGLRGAEVSRQKPPDHYRILLLGDSFTMGKGVPDEATFAAQLGRLLRGPRGERLEVLNAGVDSYTTLLSYLQLREQLRGTEPDLVVLNLDVSDLVQEQAYRKLARYDDAGRLEGVSDDRSRKFSKVVREWLTRNTYFTRLIIYWTRTRKLSPDRLTVETTVMMRNPELLAHTLKSDERDRSEQWDDVFSSIRRIRDHADQLGADFLLTVYPWGHQVSEQEWVPGRWKFVPEDMQVDDRSLRAIEKRAKELGIDYLDLFPAFRAYDGEARLYWRLDMHWTEAGHELMAREIAAHLVDRYQLERLPVRRGP